MADQMRATPRSPILGLFSDIVNLPLQYMSAPQRTQQMQGTAQFLYGTGIPKTLERMSYGDSLFSGSGMTLRPKEETINAAMNVAPFAPVAGRVAGRTGRAVGRMAGEEINAAMTGQPTRSILGQLTPKPKLLDVYHGTPYTLPPTARNPLGEFDASKIGTGEGGQAFGYGIYTAEARQVGEEYARILANADKMNQGRLTAHANAQRLAELTGSPQYAADDIRFVLESNPDHEQKKLLNETLKFLESGDYKKPLENKGNLYKIDLPDEKIATMLDWDKPVSQQKNVMNALRNEAEQRVKNNLLVNIENDIRSKLPVQDVGDDYLSMFGGQNVAINQDIRKQALEKLNQLDLNSLVDKELASFKTPDMTWDMSGGEFYKLLATRNGSAQQASNILQQQGVAGIKYLDEVSRSRGQGTRNFVVFPNEEKSMTILERNGMPATPIESPAFTDPFGNTIGSSIR
jgi:hypothetical protein